MQCAFIARRTRPPKPHRANVARQRRGSIIVLAAVLMIPIMAFVVFTVDVGYIVLTKAQLQNTADAAALAAAMELLDQNRLRGGVYLDGMENVARDEAIRVAAANRVASIRPALHANRRNAPSGDIAFGRLNANGQLTRFGDASSFNAVRVRVRLSDGQNGPLRLFFAPVFGHDSINLTATAVAALPGGVGGFRITERTGNSSLIPFIVQIDEWRDFVRGVDDDGDQYKYDSDADAVGAGSDGVPEMRLWDGNGTAPGNFGIVNIGDPSGGNAEIQRQIQEGVSQEDASYYGGEIRLDPQTGTLQLGGDTGLTTNNARAATDIIGSPVTISLYSEVTGSGSNTVYTIVGFAGVRIVDVQPNGHNRGIRIQPAIVSDDAAITETSSESWNVYGEAKLVR